MPSSGESEGCASSPSVCARCHIGCQEGQPRCGPTQPEDCQIHLPIAAAETCLLSAGRWAAPWEKMAEPGSPNKQYRVRLLPQGLPGMPTRTLAEAFPKLAIPRAPNR